MYFLWKMIPTKFVHFATPLEHQLNSLVSCMVTIGHIVTKQWRLSVRKFKAQGEGKLDKDLFQGKNAEERVGITGNRLHIKIDVDLSQEEKEAFIHDVGRHCPISYKRQNFTLQKISGGILGLGFTCPG